MAWLLLIVAGLFEIVWAIALKYTEGFTRLWPTVVFGVAMLISVALLGRAMRDIPLGTAYAIWTSIGAAGTVIVGMIFFNESRDILRILCLLLIVAGVVGLKLLTPGGAPDVPGVE